MDFVNLELSDTNINDHMSYSFSECAGFDVHVLKWWERHFQLVVEIKVNCKEVFCHAHYQLRAPSQLSWNHSHVRSLVVSAESASQVWYNPSRYRLFGVHLRLVLSRVISVLSVILLFFALERANNKLPPWLKFKPSMALVRLILTLAVDSTLASPSCLYGKSSTFVKDKEFIHHRTMPNAC